MQRTKRYCNLVRICAVGVGDSGTLTIDRLIRDNIGGVDYIVVNTSAQALARSEAPTRLLIGQDMAGGFGGGGDPHLSAGAARAAIPLFQKALAGADLVFITAGLGGGVGTGATPIIAQVSRQQGALTLAVVTRPSSFEGPRRSGLAEQGVQTLKDHVDTLIVVPNDRCADPDAHLSTSLHPADDILRQGIEAITDLVHVPGAVNLDFADLRTIMALGGAATISVSESSGPRRAYAAAHRAADMSIIGSSIDGARGILLNITVSPDVTIYEIQEAVDLLRRRAHPDVNLIFGYTELPGAHDVFKITLIATGFQVPLSEAAVLEKIMRGARQTSTPPPRAALIVEPVAAPPVPAAPSPTRKFSPLTWRLPSYFHG